MAEKVSECTRIEEMIKNPANRVVDTSIAGIESYELQDAMGRVLLRAFDRSTNKKGGLMSGGIYMANYERAKLARYFEHSLLVGMIKTKCLQQQANGIAMAAQQNVRANLLQR